MLRQRLAKIPNELQNEWPDEVCELVTERLENKIGMILTEIAQWKLPGPVIEPANVAEAEAINNPSESEAARC